MKSLIKLLALIFGFGLFAGWLRSARKNRAPKERSGRVTDGIYADSGRFTIGVVENLWVTRPLTGDVWAYYSPQTIFWEYTGRPGSHVDITLHQGGSGRVIAENVSIGDGRYGSYTLRQVPNTLPAASDYTIRVQVRGSHVHGESGPFIVGTPPGITVRRPGVGHVWPYYSSQIISWEYSGNVGRLVSLSLYRNGVLFKEIASNVPIGSGGQGSFTLQMVPNNLPGGSDYKVRVQAEETRVGGESPMFTIGTPDKIRVISPGAGTVWAIHSPQTVGWEYSGNAGHAVRIQLLRGGAVVRTLADNVPIGDGRYGSYAIPQVPVMYGSSDYVLRVKSTTRPLQDDSAAFTIGTPTGLKVTAPRTGDVWAYYSPQTVAWEYTGNLGPYVDITLHQGGAARLIAERVPTGDGRYGSYRLEQVPVINAAKDYYIKVRAWQGDVEAYAGPFTVGTPEGLRVTRPTQGDVWYFYSQQTIGWEYSGKPGREVAILLIRGNDRIRLLAENVSIGSGGVGRFNLADVPNVPAANDYVIRVQVTR